MLMEVLDKIINIAANNGTALAMVVYFAWRDYKFLTVLNTTLTKICDSLETINNFIKDEEKEV